MAETAHIRITETDTSGVPTAAYVLTNRNAVTTADPKSHGTVTAKTRLDRVPITLTSAPGSEATAAIRISPRSLQSWSSIFTPPSLLLSTYIAPLFLPIGYPHTVTSDYTPYQIYDSLQAFSSAIVGLLSSRAVLQSLGVDTESSKTSTATYATLLSIAQSTISNLTTILFAHHASRRIAPDVKFYRFLADIVNDIAFVLECLSPSLPLQLRAPVLCLGSASRAVCGVAGGSSKAVLSAHFAKNGNIGELNAKDGSQETLINLIGMWVGGLVVSQVESQLWTWVWVLGLLSMHLWFNYCAVRSLRLRNLNPERVEVVVSTLTSHNGCPNVELVGQHEGVFRSNSLLGAKKTYRHGSIRMGIGLEDFMATLGGEVRATTGSITLEGTTFEKLLSIFRDDGYILWYDVVASQAVVVIKQKATTTDQLQAWCHASRLVQLATPTPKTILTRITQSQAETKKAWPQYYQMMIDAGWDIPTSTLEMPRGRRIQVT